MTRPVARAACASLFALALSACVDSSGPLLLDAKPLLGEQLRLQFYSLRKGLADEPEQATYKWDGTKYVRTGGGMTDIGGFSVHPLGRNNLIVQTAATKRPGIFEYAVARKLTDGVYQVTAIDEADADRAARASYCRRAGESHCRIETRGQLFVFARATSLRKKGEGSLVLRLADGVPAPTR
ncbi:MAG TPA: hypothetical protein VFB29_12980 [Pseudolabrys sp.]|nr:hypothetical protein [Pseudolabrys sp.]